MRRRWTHAEIALWLAPLGIIAVVWGIIVLPQWWSEHHRQTGLKRIIYAHSSNARAWPSPHGDVLVSYNPKLRAPYEVKVWDIGTGQRKLFARTNNDFRPVFSPDGRLLATTLNNVISIYNVRNGMLRRTLTTNGSTDIKVIFSPDGSSLACTSFSGSLQIWNVKTGRVIYSFPYTGLDDYPLSFSPDGKRLLVRHTVKSKESLWLCDTSSGNLVRVVDQGKSFDVHLWATISPDGRTLAVSGHDNTLRIYDAHTGAAIRVLHASSEMVSGCKFSPDGSRVAFSAGRNGATIFLCDAHTGKLVSHLRWHCDNPTGATLIRFLPDNRTLIAGHAGNGTPRIEVFDAHTGRFLRSYNVQGTQWPTLGDDVCISPDGHVLLTTTVSGNQKLPFEVRLWDLKTGQLRRTFLTTELFPSFSSDSRTVICGERDGTITLWRTDASIGAQS